MKLPLDKLRLPRRRAADATGGAPASAGKKGKRKKLKKPVMIAAAVVLVGGAAAAYHLTAGAKADEVQTYIEAEATRQDIQKTLSATGTIQPANQYNVTSSVQGDVLSCTFEEGDTVKKGDTLYEIDKTDAQNQIEQAKLQLEQSRNSYNQTAESLNDLTVTSKKSGMITELYVEVGDEVQAGAKIADVRDSSVMELRVPFNSADVSKFGVGSTATVISPYSCGSISILLDTVCLQAEQTPSLRPSCVQVGSLVIVHSSTSCGSFLVYRFSQWSHSRQ